MFIVSDNGIGIKEQDQRTLYNLLGSIPKAYDKNHLMLSSGESIGLGLYLCKQITL
jgi:signal transduction histidine kinase